MATNRRATGQRVKVTTASAAIASGALCAQEGFVGIAIDAMVSGGEGDLYLTGIFNIAVPASTAKGDLLYVPSTAGVIADDVDLIGDLTRTPATTNSPVVKATADRDGNGFATCLLLPQAARSSRLQV